MKKIIIEKNVLLIAYKILHDALLLILLTFAGMLFVDALIPGFLTTKLSFSKVTMAMIIIVSLITYLGKKLQIYHTQEKISKGKLLPALVLFSFLLIGNSLMKFTLWENITLTLTTLLIFFLFYELFFLSEKND